MSLRNLVFAALTPLVLIAVIAAVVAGFGSILLGVRYAADDLAHHGQMAEETARLIPVAIATVVATLFLIGGAVASRKAPRVAHEETTPPRH